MLYDLERAFKEGQPSDHQSTCIEIFFGDQQFWDEQFDFGEITGDDEETDRMIDLVLNNLSDALPKHIIKMLNDWKEEGF